MGRTRSILAAGLLAVSILVTTSVMPPAAQASVVVKIDVAYARGGDTTCGGYHSPCTTPYQGKGITVSGLRTWELSMTLHEITGTCTRNATWTLVATDGSGDGLSGSFFGYSTDPLHTTVTGGSGAYAGYVDANPGGTQQRFALLAVPNPGGLSPQTFGCGSSVVTVEDTYVGSLRFQVQPG